MGTRFLLCMDKVLKPNQKWTDGNKTKVSDTQFNQSQQEEPVHDVTNARMTMVRSGMNGHYQYTAVEQQQMACLKNLTRSQIFNHPQTNPSLTQLGDEVLYLREDPIQSNIMVLSRILIRVE